jgi:hypothetical protein
VREKYCWLVADKPSEQAVEMLFFIPVLAMQISVSTRIRSVFLSVSVYHSATFYVRHILKWFLRMYAINLLREEYNAEYMMQWKKNAA